MDEQLRANPDDLVALMRAGRFSPVRVAMAAYLGDDRALTTGVEPWVPRLIAPSFKERASLVLAHGPTLKPRHRIWLAACLCEVRARRSPEADRALRLAREWCCGQVTHEDLREAERLVALEARRTGLPESLVVARLCWAARIPKRKREAHKAADVAQLLLKQAKREHRAQAELERQAQAIAAVLLDPDWPPWDE